MQGIELAQLRERRFECPTQTAERRSLLLDDLIAQEVGGGFEAIKARVAGHGGPRSASAILPYDRGAQCSCSCLGGCQSGWSPRHLSASPGLSRPPDCFCSMP